MTSSKEDSVEKIFWKDHFENLGQAITRLGEAVRHPDTEKNELLQDGCIHRFKVAHEMFWTDLRKILAYEKVVTDGPRDVLSESYQFGLIDDEDSWLRMLDDRNNTSHVYKQEDAHRVYKHLGLYLEVYEKTYARLKSRYEL